MTSARRRAIISVVAGVTLSAGLMGGVAQAQYYPYYGSRYAGPADPCARTAGNRALGWGIVGLIAGGLAGGAAAAANAVAEGAALGAFVGGITGALAGRASAACGTAVQPVSGVTPSGVAIYGQPAADYYNSVYDYGAAYPAAYPGSYYAAAPQPCCAQQTYSNEQSYEYSYSAPYEDSYRAPRY